MKEKHQSLNRSENNTAGATYQNKAGDLRKADKNTDMADGCASDRAQDYVSGDSKWSSSSHQFGREPNRKE